MTGLDPRLQHDTLPIARHPWGWLRLMNNRHFPWLILAFDTPAQGMHHLPDSQAQAIHQFDRRLSKWMDSYWQPTRLNVATIGNVVSQLHMHWVARFETDLAWPAVVWGTEHRQPYDPEQVAQIRQALGSFLAQDPLPWQLVTQD